MNETKLTDKHIEARTERLRDLLITISVIAAVAGFVVICGMLFKSCQTRQANLTVEKQACIEQAEIAEADNESNEALRLCLTGYSDDD